MSSDPIVVSGILTMFINIISSIKTMLTQYFKVFFSMLSSQISVLKLDHVYPFILNVFFIIFNQCLNLIMSTPYFKVFFILLSIQTIVINLIMFTPCVEVFFII